MCTVLLYHRPDSAHPIVLAANRNEFYERPSEPPSLESDTTPPRLAPRDLEAGGTWLGVNAEGVVAALTNRFRPPADPERTSRGELVEAALGATSAVEAGEQLADTAADRYNPFHLLVADSDDLLVAVNDGRTLTVSSADPGRHVVTERSLGAADAPRKQRVEALLDEYADDEPPSDESLRDILSDCEPDGSIASICVDLDEADYGTKSSTLLRLGDDERRYLHAEGAPCEVGYDDYSGELEELLG